MNAKEGKGESVGRHLFFLKQIDCLFKKKKKVEETCPPVGIQTHDLQNSGLVQYPVRYRGFGSVVRRRGFGGFRVVDDRTRCCIVISLTFTRLASSVRGWPEPLRIWAEGLDIFADIGPKKLRWRGDATKNNVRESAPGCVVWRSDHSTKFSTFFFEGCGSCGPKEHGTSARVPLGGTVVSFRHFRTAVQVQLLTFFSWNVSSLPKC